MLRPWAGVLVEDPYYRLADGLTFWTRQILCKMKWDTQKPKCPFKCKQHKVIKGEGSCAQASAVYTIDSKKVWKYWLLNIICTCTKVSIKGLSCGVWTGVLVLA